MAGKSEERHMASVVASGLNNDDRYALWRGVGLDRDSLVNAGLVRRAYRTNRAGDTKFCGRRTPLGKAVADYIEELARAGYPPQPRTTGATP